MQKINWEKLTIPWHDLSNPFILLFFSIGAVIGTFIGTIRIILSPLFGILCLGPLITFVLASIADKIYGNGVATEKDDN